MLQQNNTTLVPIMKVSLEKLYHYNCDRCKGWWTIGDKVPTVGDTVFCPHCRGINKVEDIQEFSTPLKKVSQYPDNLPKSSINQ